MKDWLNKRKKFLILPVLIIIVGLIMLAVVGFNKNNYYEAGKKIEIYIPKGYEKEDIISFAKESFNGKTFSFEEVEKLNQVASIKIKDYSEEELQNFKNKLIEKYEIEEDELEVYEIEFPASRIRTFVMPYILPIILITVLSILYVAIKSKKSGKIIENVLKTFIILLLTVGVYFSLILIFRLTFGSYTMPIAIAVYIMALLISVKDV